MTEQSAPKIPLLIVVIWSVVQLAAQLVYTLPVGGFLAPLWALFASIFLWVASRRARDRSLRWLALLTFPIVLGADAGELLALDRQAQTPLFFLIAVLFAMPILLIGVSATRLSPRLAGLIRRAKLPAALLVSVSAVAATPAAWDKVVYSPIAVARPEFAVAHAGCYRIDEGDWWPSFQGGHSIDMPPRVVQLDTTRGLNRLPDGYPTGYAFERNQLLIRPGKLAFSAYWLPIDENQLLLRWGNGYHGIGVGLRRTSAGYRGRAEAWTDVETGLPKPRARMTLTRISCSEVPADTARSPESVNRYMDRISSR